MTENIWKKYRLIKYHKILEEIVRKFNNQKVWVHLRILIIKILKVLTQQLN